MNESEQSTLAPAKVNLVKGTRFEGRECGETVETESGDYKKCSNPANIVTITPAGVTGLYCKTHTRDTWSDMVPPQ